MATKIMPVSDLRRNVSQTIKELQERDEPVYITQHGRPQAVLLVMHVTNNCLSMPEAG